MITEYESGDYEISELAEMYGVSRKSVYKWIERFESGGWEALQDQSRAPHHHPNATPAEIERQLIALKARWPRWGAPKLRHKLLNQFGPERCPAESTVSEILRRHGLTSRRRRSKGQAVPSQQPLAHCREANQVWCADFKGWFRTGDGKKCLPLTISDAHSRYLLCCRGLSQTTGHLSVKPLFIETFRQYGLPAAIRTDNGPPFASLGLCGLSPLAVWWVRLGIGLERIEPGCPQQNGRHERMHRTLQEETLPAARHLAAQQERFDVFRHQFNQERPHEALGQGTPASVYRPSVREYPERLPEQQGYPPDWQKRRVRHNGEIKWAGDHLYLSQTLVGQEIGLEPIGEGRWAVRFETLLLGTFDERKGRLIKCTHLVTSSPSNN